MTDQSDEAAAKAAWDEASGNIEEVGDHMWRAGLKHARSAQQREFAPCWLCAKEGEAMACATCYYRQDAIFKASLAVVEAARACALWANRGGTDPVRPLAEALDVALRAFDQVTKDSKGGDAIAGGIERSEAGREVVGAADSTSAMAPQPATGGLSEEERHIRMHYPEADPPDGAGERFESASEFADRTASELPPVDFNSRKAKNHLTTRIAERDSAITSAAERRGYEAALCRVLNDLRDLRRASLGDATRGAYARAEESVRSLLESGRKADG